MNHEVICDCQFKETCATFSDDSIPPDMKGPAGHGCMRQNDLYRSKHCQPFRCSYLCSFLTAMLKPSPAGEPVRK